MVKNAETQNEDQRGGSAMADWQAAMDQWRESMIQWSKGANATLESLVSAAPDNDYAEVKTFAENENGWIQHVTIRGASYAQVLLDMLEAISTLEEGGYKAHRGFGQSGGGARPAPARSSGGGQQRSSGGSSGGKRCEDCGGAVYDNRPENAKRQRQGKTLMPIFKCKDQRGCGWVKWPPKNDDGDDGDPGYDDE